MKKAILSTITMVALTANAQTTMNKFEKQADDIIARTLMQRGFTTGSRQFSAERNKAWKENYDFIKTLPTR